MPPSVSAQHQRAERRGQQRRAEVVDPVMCLVPGGVQRRLQDGERDHADREVDEEDPAPGQRRGEEAAEQRADHAGQPEHGTEEALVAAALARRHDVADRRHRAHHQAAAAEPLERPEQDQLGHALRDPTQRRAGQEHDQRELEHDLAAVQVAELAVDRRDRGLREQIGGDHPGDVVESAEVADDRRQRGRDDRLVQRRHQQHQHQAREHNHHAARPPVGVGADVRDAGGSRHHPRSGCLACHASAYGSTKRRNASLPPAAIGRPCASSSASKSSSSRLR